MRIMIVTDAWSPQINGVVRSLQSVRRVLESEGHEVAMIAPDQFRSVPCPTYSEIRLAFASARTVGRRIAAFAPEALHIATEGPLGLAARRWCLRRGLAFTTAYHTQFPDYLAARTRLPASWFWRYIRWFHRPAAGILVATRTIAAQLHAHGLSRTRHWGRGVDVTLFRPAVEPHPALQSLARPIQLYVGRVAVEKNVGALLDSAYPGSTVVVGDGPALKSLQERYPDATFLGALAGEALASAYAGADVFVFPSRTDTIGLVMIEALACGTPVAAFPVAGPVDVLNDEVGAMDADLGAATALALTRDRAACAAYGRSFSWEASARQFREALEPLRAQPVAKREKHAGGQRGEEQRHGAEALDQVRQDHLVAS